MHSFPEGLPLLEVEGNIGQEEAHLEADHRPSDIGGETTFYKYRLWPRDPQIIDVPLQKLRTLEGGEDI